jgi:hypothetical protein
MKDSDEEFSWMANHDKGTTSKLRKLLYQPTIITNSGLVVKSPECGVIEK